MLKNFFFLIMKCVAKLDQIEVECLQFFKYQIPACDVNFFSKAEVKEL